MLVRDMNTPRPRQGLWPEAIYPPRYPRGAIVVHQIQVLGTRNKVVVIIFKPRADLIPGPPTSIRMGMSGNP